MELTPSDRLCIPVPLYHCFGLVLGNLAAITHGSAMVYPSAGFDATAVLETVQKEKCTGLHGVNIENLNLKNDQFRFQQCLSPS
jgi:fatty-acyl-CoA synthase